MTNKELQEILKKYPDNAKINIRDYEVYNEKWAASEVIYDKDGELIIE